MSAGSAADAFNAVAVLRELAAGESISFHLIAKLENYIVICHGLLQNIVLVSSKN